MSLSPSANWTTAMGRESPDPVALVSITPAVGTTLKALSGYSSTLAYPVSVDGLTPVSTSIDPFTRKCSVSQMSVRFSADGWMRDQVVAYRLRNKGAMVSVGAASLAEVDYLQIFNGLISAVSPHLDDGTIEVRIDDALAFLRDAEVSGYWYNQHPLAVMVDIFTRAKVPSSFWDATSFDPATYSSTTSHYVVTRCVNTATKAMSLIDELARLMDGAVVIREDGILRWVPYNAAVGSVATFTHDDIDDGIELVELDSNITNRITVSSHDASDESNVDWLHHYIAEDATSQAAFAPAGATSALLTEEIETDWLNGEGLLQATMTAVSPGVGETFMIKGELWSCCGTRWPGYPTLTQPTDATLSASRTAYLQVEDEIIEVDALAPYGLEAADVLVADPMDGTRERIPMPKRGTYTVKARGALGTTAVAHDYGNSNIKRRVFDITLAVVAAESRLNRFAYGAPIIKIQLPLSAIGAQLGEAVKVVSDRIFAYGITSLDTDTAWEVVGKEIRPIGDDIGITLTLAWMRTTGWPTVSIGRTPIHIAPGGVLAAAANGAISQPVMTPKTTVTGSAGSGLAVTMSGGLVALGSIVIEAPAQDVSVQATRDNWICWDCYWRHYVVEDTAIGAGQPTLESCRVLICKATTNGVGVIAVDNTPSTGSEAFASTVIPGVAIKNGAITNTQVSASAAIDGSKLKEGTGPLTHVGVSGLYDSLDNVGDGSTYKRVTGVSAGHQVQAASIATDAVEEAKIKAGAVTSTKIGTAAVGTAALAAQAVTAAIIADAAVAPVHVAPLSTSVVQSNAHFTMWTKG